MCGISPCPLLADIRSRLPEVQSSCLSELVGPSPPSLFVGRHGYPDVRTGPSATWVPDDSGAVPLTSGDPADLFGRPLEEVAARHANLVTGAGRPDKDVDGLSPENAGRLLLGRPCLTACTPLGILEILDRHEIPLEGAEAVVLGRSNIVGKPVSLLLQQRNASVTMCHSRTRDLAAHCREADVLVAAVGVPRLVKADWVKPGAAVIDVGVSVVDGVLTGDVDTESLRGIARIVTPHRRGVGPMTITMLLRNTLQAYEAHLAE